MRSKWRFLLLMMIVLVSAALGNEAVQAVQADSQTKAAFIRNGDLWVKVGGFEQKAAEGPAITYPLWSSDGQWIAYTKGDAPGRELWVLNVVTGQHRRVHAQATGRFEWSPAASQLAYQTDSSLIYIDAEQPDQPLGMADGISSFSWEPSGKGFVAASRTELEAGGFSPVRIYRIELAKLGKPEQYTTLHVLPPQSEDFFAISTSRFKWSPDGRWIAFLAVPTASLSADSNTLCVLREDGVIFRTLDQMVRNESWFNWGPKGETLAYIAGEGRDADSNKRLKVSDMQTGRTALYTPEGYVDNDFSWQDHERIVVSRGKMLETDTSSTKRSLFTVRMGSGRQALLTKPRGDFGDYAPFILPEQLGWVRRNAQQGSVMLSLPTGKKASRWIDQLEQGEDYYGQWDHERVLDVYTMRP